MEKEKSMELITVSEEKFFVFSLQISTTDHIASYVNNIPTTEAGTHETGFKTGMTRAF